MPYDIYSEDDQYCVHKKSESGEKLGRAPGGCHSTRAQAEAHMKALYAAENKKGKELDDKEMEIVLASLDSMGEKEGETEDQDQDEKAVWTAAYINDLPDSAFLFIEGGGSKDSEGKTTPRSLRHLPYKDKEGNISIEHVRNAISRAPQVKLKSGSSISDSKATALQNRARSILKRAQGNKALDIIGEIADKLKDIFVNDDDGETTQQSDIADATDFMLWKDADTEEWRWLTSYSNNLVDREKEIISARSHRYFIEQVEKGTEPYPELWLWHIPQWKIGQADFLAYDENDNGVGFAVASGTIDKGCEPIATWLSEQEDFLVSHGMPIYSIVRDPEDERVLIQHVTREISPLPGWAAANQRLVFAMSKKEADMAIDRDVKKKLITERGLPEEVIENLEARNSETAKDAEDKEVEHKEVEVSTENVEATAEVEAEDAQEAEAEVEETEAETPEVEDETDEEKPNVDFESPPSRKEVAETFAPVLKAMNDTMENILNRIKELEAKVEAKEKSDAEKEQEQKDLQYVPPASLAALMAEKMGKTGVPVEGELADLKESKPKEADIEKEGDHPIGISLIDEMIKRSRTNSPQTSQKVRQ